MQKYNVFLQKCLKRAQFYLKFFVKKLFLLIIFISAHIQSFELKIWAFAG